MAINKVHAQTCNVAEIDLKVEYVSHEQLFVSFSRVTSKGNLFVLFDKKKAINIGFKGIFLLRYYECN